MDPQSTRIGQEIRRRRNFLRLSLEVVAGRAAITKSYLSKIERGEVTLDRRSTLLKIANALRVSVTDLGGEFHPADQVDGEAHAALPDIRLALLETSLDEANGPSARPMDELSASTLKLATWRQDCRYVDVGRELPKLLTDLHAVAAGGGTDRTRALQSIVQATQVATLLTKNLGGPDLAWVAAERGHQAAQQLDDPVFLAVSDFARVQALIASGAYERAEKIARRAADSLRGASTPQQLEVYGTSVLAAAFCSGVLGTDDPLAGIQEAGSVAKHTAGENAFFLAFSATNVMLWLMSIALERGDPVQAADVAQRVVPEEIPIKSRRVTYLIDYARALYGLRGHKDPRVIELLLEAERQASTRMHNNVWARQMVDALQVNARRTAGSADLRALAHRMGLPHAV